MSRPIITAEGLSKAYRIGLKRDRAATLTGAAIGVLKAPVENFRRLSRLNTYRMEDDSQDVYWALKDVSFEIAEGEVVGIIGRNGAGKSTLLKLLSRITEPTRGRAVLRGRVSSLLEVGTGFHPELTGRENVYLNGTILGMTKREVDRKFDEIVEFSGVERFLDTPIKRYSSGMTVRLAFAVAAHLEPEILIIDEVLAVGDAEFQKKCLGKMKDVAKGGRTVLFVSHNIGAVQSLCHKGILLNKGRVVDIGPTAHVLHTYIEEAQQQAGTDGKIRDDLPRSGTGVVRIQQVYLESLDGRPLTSALSGQGLVICVLCHTDATRTLRNIDIGISLHTQLDQLATVHYASYTGDALSAQGATTLFRCTIQRLSLSPGRYSIGSRIVVQGLEADWPQGALHFFDVEAGDYYGTGRQLDIAGAMFYLDAAWSATPAPPRAVHSPTCL